MSLVFDLSALIAYLRAEPGGDFVRDLIEDADVPKFAHAVNLCEVHYEFLRNSSDLWADAAIEELLLLGIIERNDLDVPFRQSMARLISASRAGGSRLALGDAFGVTLARTLDADLVTADRHDLESLAQSGICRIMFIR